MEPLPSPGLPRRLAAIVYDTLLILPIIMVAVAIATGISVWLSGDPGNDDYSATLPPLLVQVIAISCVAGFYCYFWRLRGQTLGMQAWRIRLRSADGKPVTLGQALLRCLCALLSAAPFGAGYLWCLVDRQGRSWHDRLSGTELELVPKKGKA